MCTLYERQRSNRSDRCERLEGEEKKNNAISTFSIDYMFLTKETDLVNEAEAEKMDKEKLSFPVLVGKDRKSGAIIAHKVQAKGKGNGYIIKRLTDLEELGYGGTNILLKCDQESAVVEVQR